MSSENESEWKVMEETEFISVRLMLLVVVVLSIVVQTVAQLMSPSFWLNYQLLAFILATNVGAVILAMMAQHSADNLSKRYRQAFTPDFYRGIELFSSFFSRLEKESISRGTDIEERMDDLVPRVHDFLLSNDPLASPPELTIEDAPEWQDESELFQ